MNHFLEYYTSQKKEINDKLASLEKQMDVEELHDLRVAFKRMRALFRMLKKEAPSWLPPENDYEHFRNFFKTAGKLRDIHVQQKEMTKHETALGLDLVFVNDYLKNLKSQYETDFYKALGEFDNELFNRYETSLQDELGKHDDYELYKWIVDFTYQRMHKVKLKIDKAKTAENLHKVRSNLKDIMYYLEIVNSEDDLEKISDENIKNAQSFLGDWHDNVVSYSTLQEFKEANREIVRKNTGTVEIFEDYLVRKIHFH